jgi:hypothetical protein
VIDVRVDARPATVPADWDRRSTVAAVWWGRALVMVAILAALVTLAVNGDGLSLGELASSPHLLDISTLSDDPLHSIWFLHSQVPVHNAVVGAVGWLPLPLAGSLFALFGVAVLATGLLLHAVLVRWGTPPLAAGALVALAMVNPALLDTIGSCGIQVPVALLVVAALYAFGRYVDDPRWAWLLMLSFVLTAGVLTWQVLQPAWVVAIVVLAVVARPAGGFWRRLLVGLAVPLVFIGGWALKNEVVFGEPTLASSVGFDLQQGITGPMSAQGVAEARQDGAVAPLAQQQPWGTLAYYGADRGGTGICFPTYAHPTTVDMTKDVPGDQIAPNYNNDCYLPLYRQARHDALTLALRYPARYLTTRDAGLVLAYDTAEGCASEPCTWMDRLYEPLLGKVDGQVTMYDWNLRLFGTDADHLDVTLSMVLVVASAAIGWRGLVALWRARRLGWRRRPEWTSGELLWIVAALTVVLVIGGMALVEVGDNGRFRTSLDPILLTLPLAALVRILWPLPRPSTSSAPADTAPAPTPSPDPPGPGPLGGDDPGRGNGDDDGLADVRSGDSEDNGDGDGDGRPGDSEDNGDRDGDGRPGDSESADVTATAAPATPSRRT